MGTAIRTSSAARKEIGIGTIPKPHVFYGAGWQGVHASPLLAIVVGRHCIARTLALYPFNRCVYVLSRFFSCISLAVVYLVCFSLLSKHWLLPREFC